MVLTVEDCQLGIAKRHGLRTQPSFSHDVVYKFLSVLALSTVVTNEDFGNRTAGISRTLLHHGFNLQAALKRPAD